MDQGYSEVKNKYKKIMSWSVGKMAARAHARKKENGKKESINQDLTPPLVDDSTKVVEVMSDGRENDDVFNASHTGSV